MSFLFFFYRSDARVVFIFQNCHKDWILNVVIIGIKVLILCNFKVFTTFEKKLFSTSAVLDSLLISSPFSLRWILSLFIDLLHKRGLTVAQNLLLSIMSFSSKFPLWFILVYLKRETHLFLCWIYKRRFSSFHVLFLNRNS